MDYLAAMRAFVRAVDLGSFSKAAAEERLKVSTVSRYVSALEADLGAALFNRSTRRLHVTEVGAAFYERSVAILADVEDARLAATSLNARPQGLLKINIPGAFGRRHVVPHLKDFREMFPLIRLDVTLTDATIDLIETGTDVLRSVSARSGTQRLLPAGSRRSGDCWSAAADICAGTGPQKRPATWRRTNACCSPCNRPMPGMPGQPRTRRLIRSRSRSAAISGPTIPSSAGCSRRLWSRASSELAARGGNPVRGAHSVVA